ncbi:MAG: phosphonate transport system permease protein, partial [Cognaticolwellia sp.]
MKGSGWTLLRWAGAVLALVLGAGWYLGLGQGVSPADWSLVGAFFSAALSPSLVDQDLGQSLLPVLADASWQTLRFALAGLFLACLFGLPLGLVSATRVAGKWAWGPRLLASSLRAVHELLWAILILAALGRSEGAAVLAIALPYGGTLAKVFSELLDEAPQDSHDALLEQGARPAQAVFLGLLPRVVPDLA